MVVTENAILFELKDALGDIMFESMGPKYYMEKIKRKTLVTWSIFFPKIVRGIVIKEEDAIPTRHPQTGVICTSYMYKVPKFNPEDEYINYEQVFYPGNLVMNQASSSLPAMNGLLNMVSEYLPNNQFYGKVRYSFGFIPPDILCIDPPTMRHLDFSVNMQRLIRLHEVPIYYYDEFTEMCVIDCKISLYNKFKHLKNGSTFQGIEINTELISDLESAKDERKEKMEKYRKEFFKDPTRFAALMEYEEFK